MTLRIEFHSLVHISEVLVSHNCSETVGKGMYVLQGFIVYDLREIPFCQVSAHGRARGVAKWRQNWQRPLNQLLYPYE